MQQYGIPTKTDIEKIIRRLDRIEKQLSPSASVGKRKSRTGVKTGKGSIEGSKKSESAANHVFKVIKRYKSGAGFEQIHAGTGFDEKKIRNILYRLHKMNRIKRKSRGIYIVS